MKHLPEKEATMTFLESSEECPALRSTEESNLIENKDAFDTTSQSKDLVFVSKIQEANRQHKTHWQAPWHSW